ncbi:hypothetical protein M8494_01040 [Serratia ureilytica]
MGGWLADRLLGNRVAVIAGAALMTLGHIVLGLSAVSAQSLYLALAIIICGYGLFKSISAACWANCIRRTTRAAKGLRCCTPPATSVPFLAPIACGLAAERYGWHVGFALAGIGMFAGLAIFLLGGRHFRHTRGVNAPLMRAKAWVCRIGVGCWRRCWHRRCSSRCLCTTGPAICSGWCAWRRWCWWRALCCVRTPASAGAVADRCADAAARCSGLSPSRAAAPSACLSITSSIGAGSVGRCRPRCSSRLTPVR